jgi:Kef-type K+ transport system membrane component KefB
MFVIGLEFNLPKLRSMRQTFWPGFVAGGADHVLAAIWQRLLTGNHAAPVFLSGR